MVVSLPRMASLWGVRAVRRAMKLRWVRKLPSFYCTRSGYEDRHVRSWVWVWSSELRYWARKFSGV